ncbi:protein of unknown function [Monaibacterium marinum]|uniref:YjiS-like domain-containing protein n=1 Tax=Pontivivens marinum TaxID=1690039 RepID=A0A2C9CP64_9RHOB|nr:DUF1127 domain-containing protein [Monaibacterium marinum]SOH93032.1 protein of unknown function [Monaibacterium marinum]
MTMTVNTAFAPIGSDLVYRVVTSIEHAIVELRAIPRARATVKSLNSLSNRELSDLGLVRADIQRIARNMSRRVL